VGENNNISAVLREVTNSSTVHLENVQWCELTSIGLKIKRQKATLEEMQETLDQLMIMDKGSPLALGDAMCLGERRHGEKWAQAVDVNKKTGIKIKTLLEYRRVSEKVPFSIRLENPNIDWSHYQLIADRPDTERRRWVELVAEHGWSISQLKGAFREVDSPAVNPDDDANYLDPAYKTFLLDYIATQYSFLNRCTYEPFKNEIDRSIRAAKFQHARTPSSDYEAVKNQVDKLCTTSDEIAEDVALSEEEIKRICGLIVEREPEVYEWRPIGVNTDMARGSRELGIFRKDSPHYEGGKESRSNYSPTVDWE
jgi:hypothetical protein